MKNLSSKIANESKNNNTDYAMAISVLKGSREYTNYGGSKYGASKERTPERYLRIWGIDFQTGNDAPRGGKIGNYIELSKKGMTQTKVFRAEIALELAKEKDERLEQKEIQEQKIKISESQILENIKENKDFFNNAKSKLSELKANGNKDAWHVLANTLVQIACKNDMLLGWSNIYKLIQNN